MIIITVDGTEWEVKHQQNKESVSVNNGTSENNYPGFIGSKLYQNSTSSDIYTLNFAVSRFQYVGFKEAFKKFVTNKDDAIDYGNYGKLTHIVLVHELWGIIRGLVKGNVSYDTSGTGEVKVSCIFQEHTADEPVEKKDLEQENTDANANIDTLSDDGEFDEFDKPALLVLLDSLNALYDNIQDSAVIAAFNDLKSALNDALLNYQKVMNAVKKIIALPLDAISDVRKKVDFFKKQSEVFKNIPNATYNLSRFHVRCMALNLRWMSRIPFLTKSVNRNKTGVKTVPLK